MFKDVKIKFSTLFILTSILFISASDYKFLTYLPLIVTTPLIRKKYGKIIAKGSAEKLIESFPLAYFIFSLIFGVNLFYTLSNLLVIILFAKQILPCKEKDYYEIFLVGILLILLSSVSTISLTFGIFLFAFLVSGTLMLTFSGIESNNIKIPRAFYHKVVIFSVISMLFSFVLFFSFPRLSLGYFHGIRLSPESQSGFSTNVVIEKGAVKLNNRIVMRVEGKSLLPPLYLSGMHYAYFTGSKWIKTQQISKLFPYDSNNDFGLTFGLVKSTIFLEPNGTDVLFGPEKLLGIHGEFLYLRKNKFGDFLTDQIYYKTIKYDAFSSITGKSNILIRESLSRSEKEKYLQLPKLPETFKEIAKEAAGNGKTAEDKAKNIADYLRKNYQYSLNPSSANIEDFVINKKTGYCQHFATAFVLFARINGIPARLVSGFVTREYNPDGEYFIVRAKDAHTWAEVYITGKGWIRIDPTPPSAPPKLSHLEMLIDNIKMSWYRNVITYNSAKQIQMLHGIRSHISNLSLSVLNSVNITKNLFKKFKNILILILIAFLLFIILRKRKPTSKEIAVLNMLEKRIGEDRKKSETLLEFAARKGKLSKLKEPIMLYYKLRYSKETENLEESEIIKKIKILVKEIT